MLHLPQVTLILLTNRDFEGAKHAVDESCKTIEFGGAKIIWDEKCNSIEEWNRKVIYDLPKYVDTSHALLIHQDGAIKDSSCWDNSWLNLDYIGSPWPPPNDNYSYRSESGKIQRVGNSVSLRSKKLMDLIATKPEKEFWATREKYGNSNEDGFICCHNREWLESKGMKFATFEQALKFGKEAPLPENAELSTFVWHAFS